MASWFGNDNKNSNFKRNGKNGKNGAKKINDSEILSQSPPVHEVTPQGSVDKTSYVVARKRERGNGALYPNPVALFFCVLSAACVALMAVSLIALAFAATRQPAISSYKALFICGGICALIFGAIGAAMGAENRPSGLKFFFINVTAGLAVIAAVAVFHFLFG
ncbi:MAG: hypothetical protein FWE62_02285 [Firmicutes bacterium]|nr:hypothetical protein [Bacillota bacterium]